MEEQRGTNKNPRQHGGLYDRVNLSVEALNKIIVVLCLLLVLCIGLGVSKGGYEVEFDSQGGTVVEGQRRMYGELVEEPSAPSREGWRFAGWYRDPDASMPWNLETDPVTGSMTLYARWISQE